MSRKARPFVTSLGRALVLFLAVATVSVEIPVLHRHGDVGGRPALYDEECPLERLATAPSGATFSDPVEVAQPLGVAAAPSVILPPAPPAPSLAPAGPRAPPATT